MDFQFGETVVLNRRTVVVDGNGRPVTDAYGNDVYITVPETLLNVPVWPSSSTEAVQGQDMVTSDLTAVLPAGTDISSIDSVQVYGNKYEVVGEPGRYLNSFSGTALVETQLKRVTG